MGRLISFCSACPSSSSVNLMTAPSPKCSPRSRPSLARGQDGSCRKTWIGLRVPCFLHATSCKGYYAHVCPGLDGYHPLRGPRSMVTYHVYRSPGGCRVFRLRFGGPPRGGGHVPGWVLPAGGDGGFAPHGFASGAPTGNGSVLPPFSPADRVIQACFISGSTPTSA